MAPGNTFVSVIIPCRQEEKYIARMLESLLANDYPRDRLELLVVDAMSTDGTREIVREFIKEHPLSRSWTTPKKSPRPP
jgi:succinoglycan biosynthesis protein ExoA